MITVVATGGFDPIHSGHIKYLKDASLSGTRLIVGVNSDEWLTRKKGQAFMSFVERKTMIEHLEMVNEVISFNENEINFKTQKGIICVINFIITFC